jgi:hypothetical protein
MREFRDKSGRVIKRGDIIVYAVSYGRSPGLSYGRVLDIVKSKSGWTPTKVKVKVMGVDQSYSGGWDANTKAGLLEFSQRMLVVDPLQVPTPAFEKLMSINLPEAEPDDP